MMKTKFGATEKEYMCTRLPNYTGCVSLVVSYSSFVRLASWRTVLGSADKGKPTIDFNWTNTAKERWHGRKFMDFWVLPS